MSADALDGLLNEHVAALRLQSDDALRALLAAVANDALEFAATHLDMADATLDPQRAADLVRAMKRTA